MLENDEYYEGQMPWERGGFGTKDGKDLGAGFCDGNYEIIGEGCYRKLPADPGSE